MAEETPLNEEQEEFIAKLGNAAVDAVLEGGDAYDDTENALFALSNAGAAAVMSPSKDKRLDGERDGQTDEMNAALDAKMDVARAAAQRAAGAAGGGGEELEHKATEGGGGGRRRRKGKGKGKGRKKRVRAPKRTLLEAVSEAQLAKAFDRIIKERIDQHIARVDEQIADMCQGVVSLRQLVMDIREGIPVEPDSAEYEFPERLTRAGAGDRTAYGVSAASAQPPGAPPPSDLEVARANLDRVAAELGGGGPGGKVAEKKARRGRVNAATQAMRLQRKQQREREASRRKADADARAHNPQRGGMYGGGGTGGMFAKPRSRAITAPPATGAAAEKKPPKKRVVDGEGGTFWMDLTVLSEGQQGKVHGKGVCAKNCCRGVCDDPHLTVTIGHFHFLELLKFHRAQHQLKGEKNATKRALMQSKLKVCTISSFHRQGLIKFAGRLDVVRPLDVWVLKWMMTEGSGAGTRPGPYWKDVDKKYKAPTGNYFDGHEDAVMKFFADLQHDIGKLKTESMKEHVMPSATHQSENYAASSMFMSFKTDEEDPGESVWPPLMNIGHIIVKKVSAKIQFNIEPDQRFIPPCPLNGLFDDEYGDWAAGIGHLPLLKRIRKQAKHATGKLAAAEVAESGGDAAACREAAAAAVAWEWQARTCTLAAASGSLATVKWLRAQGCPWEKDTCAAAAAHGRFEVLKWLRAAPKEEDKCPWDQKTCDLAKEHEETEIHEWVVAAMDTK